jgi:hypothetical protein
MQKDDSRWHEVDSSQNTKRKAKGMKRKQKATAIRWTQLSVFFKKRSPTGAKQLYLVIRDNISWAAHPTWVASWVGALKRKTEQKKLRQGSEQSKKEKQTGSAFFLVDPAY